MDSYLELIGDKTVVGLRPTTLDPHILGPNFKGKKKVAAGKASVRAELLRAEALGVYVKSVSCWMTFNRIRRRLLMPISVSSPSSIRLQS